MNVTITFTQVGADAGTTFDLYSDTDPINPFDSGVTKAELLAGYGPVAVPEGTTEVTCVATDGCGSVVVSCDLGTTTSTTTIEPGLYIQIPNSVGSFIYVEPGQTYDGYPEPASVSGQDNDIYVYAIGVDVTITSITIGDTVNFNYTVFPDTLPHVIPSELPGYVNWKIGFNGGSSGDYSTTVSIVHDAINVASPFVFTLNCSVTQ